ncbi:MAG: T9SS C-terminal target domain-containing protein [Candidatus Latescibacterota bacterium]|nr:MAG: T9SS C-terminal target domain-containing protein [Candidatus Latescibacterota bacterium]
MLDPGDTAIVAVGHVVPLAAEDGDKDTLCAFLTTFLEKNGPYLDTSCVVTTAIASCVGGVDVTGDTYLSGGPGDTLYADFMVQNTGSGPDRFLLATQSDLGWPVSIVGSDTTDLLGPGSSDNVEVRVIIPNDASCEALDRVDLDAFSLCDPSVWDRATVEIGVDPVCAVSVVAHTEDSTGAPGQTMRYYFDIANEGNCGFQYGILVYQSPTWDTAYAITSPVQIPDGGEVTVFVDVTIPGGAEPGDEHTLTVCGSCYHDDPRIGVAKRVEIACDSTITRVPTGCEADQPILSLGGYQTINYGGPSGLWEVQVALKNNGPGKAEAIAAEMHHDVAWLLIPDPVCSYPDLTPGSSSYGYDSYTFDLQNYPGGSFNVWFDVTYTDSCGNPYQVRLDPTFRDPAEGGVPVPASHFALHQNVPNPFNPETSITFELSSGGNTELMIYNAAGQLVKTLWQGSLPTGHHTFLWNGESDRGTSVPSGSYFYSLRNGGLTETRRMVLVR